MQEHQLYDKNGLFHNIVKQSAIMKGRYAVLETGTNELNTNNLISGLEFPKGKYPLVACLPPVSAIDSTLQKGQWEYFLIRLIFCATSFYTGDNQIKSHDRNTNTSLHPISKDWNDMKQCSFAFLNALELMQQKMRNQFIIDQRNKWQITRFSKLQNDRLSGVIVQLTIGLAVSCEFADIPADKIAVIEVPNVNHPNHLH